MVPQHPTPGNPLLPQSATVGDQRAFAVAMPAVAEALASLLPHDVDTWPERGLDRIKLRTVRRVFRGELGGVPVHVKVFRADTLAARARAALRRGRGEREVENLQRLRALGLPAVEPLAYGIAREQGQACSFLVTRTTAAEPFSFPGDERTLREVGALLRRVHDAGLRPDDLHAGNLLVAADGTISLCDLTSVRHGGAPSLRERATGLTLFCGELDGGVLDDGAAGLLAAYRQAGPELPGTFVDELRKAAHRWRAANLRSFGRRSMRACRHTDVERRRRATPRWCWYLPALDAETDLRAACLAFAPDQQEPRRSGRRGAVWLLSTLVVKGRDAGKARKLWRAHYWLAFAGVAAAQPIALCQHHQRGFVFTRRCPNVDLAEELASDQLTTAAGVAAARALGEAMGRLHAHGLRNRDPKLENFVRDPSAGTVALVDLDGIALHGASDTRGQGRDLGRLYAAFLDAGSPFGAIALRSFLRAYLRARHQLLQPPPGRRLWRRAAQRAGEWQRRHPATGS